jgi:hypothetical protein
LAAALTSHEVRRIVARTAIGSDVELRKMSVLALRIPAAPMRLTLTMSQRSV